MHPRIAPDTFDDYQRILARELVEQIRLKLIEGGCHGQQLKELTGHIAFSVASTLDDTARVEHNGIEVRPYLTFLDEQDQLVHGGENSFMHEYVAELVDEVFSRL